MMVLILFIIGTVVIIGLGIITLSAVEYGDMQRRRAIEREAELADRWKSIQAELQLLAESKDVYGKIGFDDQDFNTRDGNQRKRKFK